MNTPRVGPLGVLSATGNMLYRAADGSITEVDTAGAADGDVLTRVAGVPTWATGGTPSGGGLTQVGMAALTETDLGVFADITADLLSASGSAVPIIPTLPIDSAFYIGGDATFPGFFINDTVAMVLGAGSVVVEISTGAGTWAAIEHMSAADDASDQYAGAIFERVQEDEVYFGDTTTPGPWTSETVNGIAKFWIRVRVTAAITTAPTAEQAKLQMNATRFAPTTEITNFFGAARPAFRLASSLKTKAAIGAPKNEDIDWSTNITSEAKDNKFEDGDDMASVNAIVIPFGIDTSLPLTVTFGWSKVTAGAGAVEWFLANSVPIDVGDTLDNTIADSEQSIIVGAGTVDVLQETVFSVDISAFLPGDRLPLRLRRDATGGNANDTYGGDVYIVDLELRARAWKI